MLAGEEECRPSPSALERGCAQLSEESFPLSHSTVLHRALGGLRCQEGSGVLRTPTLPHDPLQYLLGIGKEDQLLGVAFSFESCFSSISLSDSHNIVE